MSDRICLPKHYHPNEGKSIGCDGDSEQKINGDAVPYSKPGEKKLSVFQCHDNAVYHDEESYLQHVTIIVPFAEDIHESNASTNEEEVHSDPWNVMNNDLKNDEPNWSDLSIRGKVKRLALGFLKIILLAALLYMFICSLDVMGSAFTLLGGTAAGEAVSDSELLNNPIAGLMIGVLMTALLQSSSTTTSIIVSMVASDILGVQQSVPIIMGANIGTSVTNTIVAMGQVGERDQFRRAFAGATVHDCFNWLSVIILLPLEVATSYLYRLTGAIVGTTTADANEELSVDFLKVITKPLTNLIIQLDKKLINDIALGVVESEDVSLVKRWCETEDLYINVTRTVNGSVVTEEITNGTIYVERCVHIFAKTTLNDAVIGAILLIVSLSFMMACLVLLVKLLQSMLKGNIAKLTKKVINANFPGKLSFLTGYFAILVGAGLTMLLQSSSVFTSTLTPLVGVGVVTLERTYPLTLGANIGTTITGLLAALASADSKDFQDGLQIALCHFFFNISGIILWYPVPLCRRIPIKLAKMLGNTTAKYRWFASLYILLVFFLLPGVVFALSVAGWQYLVAFGVPFLALLVFVITVNVLQSKKPNCLPRILRNWDFLPLCLHSLEPLDRLISKLRHMCNCFSCRHST
ncbi:sodium-dependent phosphate transport protein 2A-like [Saccoglossus kowalevskii]